MRANFVYESLDFFIPKTKEEIKNNLWNTASINNQNFIKTFTKNNSEVRLIIKFKVDSEKLLKMIDTPKINMGDYIIGGFVWTDALSKINPSSNVPIDFKEEWLYCHWNKKGKVLSNYKWINEGFDINPLTDQQMSKLANRKTVEK